MIKGIHYLRPPTIGVGGRRALGWALVCAAGAGLLAPQAAGGARGEGPASSSRVYKVLVYSGKARVTRRTQVQCGSLHCSM